MPPFLTHDALALPGIAHGFFTREGGVSDGIYASLNCGIGSKDERDRVLENRARVTEALGVPSEALATPYQVHSADVVTVETAWAPGEGPKADAVVTDRPGVALGVGAADCGPVLFADAEARVIGAAHAGWRGALAGVTDSAIAAMEKLGADRRNIVAVLAEAGAEPQHLVRMTWYVTDKSEYLARLRELGTVYREIIGRHFPAMALVQVSGLVEDRAKVEIEATAVIPASEASLAGE